MNIDERQLNDLITESQDLQSDALRGLPAFARELNEMRLAGEIEPAAPSQIAAFNAGRRESVKKLGLSSLVSRGVMAGGFASALAAILTRPALADSNMDIQMMQTNSSLEVLAVAAYGAALQLPFIANGNPVIKAFAQTTMMQHDQHRQAFQQQSEALGGAVQTNPDPALVPVVNDAKPTLQSPLDVVKLAMKLEQVATDTYLADLAMLANTKAKTVTASIMGVECQHLATLRAVDALLSGGAEQLIAIPTNVAALPAAAGSVAFPNATEGTSAARPIAEGALQ